MRRLVRMAFPVRAAMIALGLLFSWQVAAQAGDSGAVLDIAQAHDNGLISVTSASGWVTRTLLFSPTDGSDKGAFAGSQPQWIGLATSRPIHFDTGYVSRISSLVASAWMGRAPQYRAKPERATDGLMTSVSHGDIMQGDDDGHRTQSWGAAMAGRSLMEMDVAPPLFLAEESDYLHFQLVRYFRWSK